MKVILNKCYGGFSVSHEGYMLYAKKNGLKIYAYDRRLTNPCTYRRIKTCEDNFGITYFLRDYGETVDEKNINWDDMIYLSTDFREDNSLVEVVEELGEKASGKFGRLVVVEIPDGMDYVIDDYDGFETLHENVRVW